MGLWYSVQLCLPIEKIEQALLDEAIQIYIDKYPGAKDKMILEVDGKQYASIGYILLTIEIGYRFARFSYAMPTNIMSRLLIDSESMRNRFSELSDAAGAVANFIFRDEDTYPHFLSDPNQITPVDLDEELFFTTQEEFDKGYAVDIDRFTEAILAAKSE
ncbi:MAG: hypothetical protein ABI690_30915 [Chloroflexota bacterium]